ncbi:hypothetical protein EV356DRAFT_500255 [Viridothelium virens]|uniref:Uncharacterized protein n=1 Tax=Viridothelium virens TaxID=1048519 RepID=A0A6A6HD19_VIRVR|nr:hypothetical protein EV356DRAFT_500255 [Viridothelium virens]
MSLPNEDSALCPDSTTTVSLTETSTSTKTCKVKATVTVTTDLTTTVTTQPTSTAGIQDFTCTSSRFSTVTKTVTVGRSMVAHSHAGSTVSAAGASMLDTSVLEPSTEPSSFPTSFWISPASRWGPSSTSPLMSLASTSASTLLSANSTTTAYLFSATDTITVVRTNCSSIVPVTHQSGISNSTSGIHANSSHVTPSSSSTTTTPVPSMFTSTSTTTKPPVSECDHSDMNQSIACTTTSNSLGNGPTYSGASTSTLQSSVQNTGKLPFSMSWLEYLTSALVAQGAFFLF